mgnify:CR=1 FL=1
MVLPFIFDFFNVFFLMIRRPPRSTLFPYPTSSDLNTLVRQVEGTTGQGNQNDPYLHFGLGAHEGPVTLEIRWPDGRKQSLKSVSNRALTVTYFPAGE